MKPGEKRWRNYLQAALVGLIVCLTAFSASAISSCASLEKQVHAIECNENLESDYEPLETCSFVQRDDRGEETSRLSIAEGVARGINIGIKKPLLDRFIECCQGAQALESE